MAPLLLALLVACTPEEIALRDELGNEESFAALNKSQEANVWLFFSPECPLCINYVPTFRDMLAEWQGDSVMFRAVVSGTYYDASDMQAFRQKQQIELPVYFDPSHKLRKAYRASITPEVLLVDREGKMLYRGAIDNWAISLGKKRLKVSEHYLRDAVDQFLAGKKIETTRTQAIGCFIE